MFYDFQRKMTASASTNDTVNGPHSSRVPLSVPSNLQVAKLNTAATLPSPPASPPSSPPLPPRSPLRPKAHPSPTDTRSSISLDTIADILDMTLSHSRRGTSSFPVDSRSGSRPKTPDKPLPLLPPPPIPPLPSSDDEDSSEEARPSTPVDKRYYPLVEMLSSERAYASDLVLIRDVHMALAIGRPSTFDAVPATPPSSGPSSRAVSTASSSSSRSSYCGPMTPEDVKTIFINIPEIAEFADEFSEELEKALGSVIEGGSGEDRIGELFLKKIPEMEPLYNTYITRHPAALEHLNALPKTEALKQYLLRTRTLAESLSHAWDMSSLLIKPVQRLMKYQVLLDGIIEQTPDTHPDKENLKLARTRIVQVTEGVNEGRRRREVVKGVLTGCSPGKKSPADVLTKVKRKGLNLGIAASVNLGRVKGVRAATFKVKEGKEANQEAEQVARMGEDLKACELWTRRFAEAAVNWIDTATTLTEALKAWTISFGKTTGANGENRSAAFDAFLLVIDNGLLAVCNQFKSVVHAKLLPKLSLLRDATNNPERLLEAMRTLEPLHYGLLNLDVSQSGAPTQLQEASKSYIALRMQLYSELPVFLGAFRRGSTALIKQYTDWQVEFYQAYKTKWTELWDALKVEDETQGAAESTLQVWWSRFQDVAMEVDQLTIVRPIEREMYRARTRGRTSSLSESIDFIETGSTLSTVLISNLAALDARRATTSMASSSTLVPPSLTPSSSYMPPSPDRDSWGQALDRKKSNESVHSRKSGKSGRAAHKHSNSTQGAYRGDMFSSEEAAVAYADAIHAIISTSQKKPAYHRTTSMPISPPMPLRKSSSQGRLLDSRHSLPGSAPGSRGSPQTTPPQHYTPPQQYEPEEKDARGRPSHKPSIKRRITDSMKSGTSTPTSRQQQRSPSLPAMKHFNNARDRPQSSPTGSTFTINQARAHSAYAKAKAAYTSRRPLYSCRAIHPCEPPPGVCYKDLPFFTLRVGEVYDVLEEKGHPSMHENLPLYVDDGEDCLLLCIDNRGDVGWALASFLYPDN